MTLRELTEKHNRLLAEARQRMAAPELTAEQRAQVDAMLAEANTLKADIERLESCAETEERSLPVVAPPREQFDGSGEADNRSMEERRAATNVALRSFLRGERFEQRDLTIAADGGVMIPVAALAPIEAQRSAGTIYDIVHHLRMSTGEPVRVPLWDDTANMAVLDSAPIGNGTDPKITGITINTDGLRLGDPLLLDNKLIQDVSYDVVGYVNQNMQERYLRSVSQYINVGNGSNYLGLIGNVPAAVTSEVKGAIDYDDFVNLIAALDPAYSAGACFSFSTSTLGMVLKIKDGEGRPIFIPYLDGAKSGFAGQILGYPVKINQFAQPVASGNTPVLFGDHAKAYTLREVTPGVVIKQSNQRWIELNRLGVVGFARGGGAPTLANTTTYSPIQALEIQ